MGGRRWGRSGEGEGDGHDGISPVSGVPSVVSVAVRVTISGIRSVTVKVAVPSESVTAFTAVIFEWAELAASATDFPTRGARCRR